eukprot:gene10822-12032_t
MFARIKKELTRHSTILHVYALANKQRRKKSSKKEVAISTVFNYCSRAFGSNKVNAATSSKSKVRSGQSIDMAGNSVSVPR